MQKQTLRLSLVVVALLFCAFFLATSSNSSPRPLRRSELLALVAGEILPENVVSDIQSRGLSFTPDGNYKSLLSTAGADARILTALNTAKVTPGDAGDPGNSALLQLFG